MYKRQHIWDVRKTAGMVFQNPDNQIIGNIGEEDVGFGPENIGVPLSLIHISVRERCADEVKRSLRFPHRPNEVRELYSRSVSPKKHD